MRNLTPFLQVIPAATFSLTCSLMMTLAVSFPASAQTLTGSRSSMQNQHQQAVRHGYTFIQTSGTVAALVDRGELVNVRPNQHLVLHGVSFPYLRPTVKTLLERLGSQYYVACGEKLTVTSMTRPIERQPANAASDSVHPTGMAFDLRIPAKSSCRSWLERTLLELEKTDVLDATRERRPPHYHIAVFPESYEHYLASLTGQEREYIVRSGDTLSAIARRMDTSIVQLRAANGLRGDLINVGQKLLVPAERTIAIASTVPISPVNARAPADSRPREPEPVVRELTHQVKRGETLWRIASRYRTSVDALRSENGLSDDLLRIGQVLRIKIEES